jgi:hypothetical protein
VAWPANPSPGPPARPGPGALRFDVRTVEGRSPETRHGFLLVDHQEQGIGAPFGFVRTAIPSGSNREGSERVSTACRDGAERLEVLGARAVLARREQASRRDGEHLVAEEARGQSAAQARRLSEPELTGGLVVEEACLWIVCSSVRHPAVAVAVAPHFEAELSRRRKVADLARARDRVARFRAPRRLLVHAKAPEAQDRRVPVASESAEQSARDAVAHGLGLPRLRQGIESSAARTKRSRRRPPIRSPALPLIRGLLQRVSNRVVHSAPGPSGAVTASVRRGGSSRVRRHVRAPRRPSAARSRCGCWMPLPKPAISPRKTSSRAAPAWSPGPSTARDRARVEPWEDWRSQSG